MLGDWGGGVGKGEGREEDTGYKLFLQEATASLLSVPVLSQQ